MSILSPVREQRLLLLSQIYGVCPIMGAGFKTWEARQVVVGNYTWLREQPCALL